MIKKFEFIKFEASGYSEIKLNFLDWKKKSFLVNESLERAIGMEIWLSLDCYWKLALDCKGCTSEQLQTLCFKDQRSCFLYYMCLKSISLLLPYIDELRCSQNSSIMLK